MMHRLPFNLNEGGWLERIAAEPDGPLPLAAGTGFRFGELSFEQTQLTLRLLKQDETSRFIQAPKLIALDNHVATIFVGESIRYARTEAQSNQSGGLQFAIDEADDSPVQTGFQMLVIPHVIPGENRVMMTVIPQSKRLTGTSTTLPGFDEFRSGAGVNEVSILLPREQSSTVVTHMILESGQTAVLGGLLTDRETEATNAVPFLGKLPLIGFFFSSTTHSITKDHLMIFITPRIIRSPDKVRDALQRELDARRKAIEEEFDRVHGGTAETAMGK
jgi:general secretion pathway protein D